MRRDENVNKAVDKLPFAIDPFSRDTLTKQVVSGMRRSISEGFYRIGDALPPRDVLARGLRVSECVVRAAMKELMADGLVAGRPRRGFVVMTAHKERRNRLVLDISTENLGAFSSCVSTAECMRTLMKSGCRVQPVVLGVDSRETSYLQPLKEALRQAPDLAVVRVASSRRRVVTGLLAAFGCPYVTLTLGKRSCSPGRFMGNIGFSTAEALDDMARACVRQGLRSALQVDFGVDTYVNAVPALKARGIATERLSVRIVGNRSLDEIVEHACARFGSRLDRGDLPDLVFASDDYLSLGVCEALRRRRIAYPDQVRLVIYVNVGSGLFPFRDMARIEFDPRLDGREMGKCLMACMETGKLGTYSNSHVFVGGRSFSRD